MDYTKKLAVLRRYVRRYDDYRETRDLMESLSAELVKEWRELTSMSLRKFAVAIGVTPSFLSKVERGLEPLPPEVARRILEMHG